MAAPKKLTQKKIDDLVDASYRRSCSGVSINVMDISKVFKVGTAAVLEGKRDAELDKAVRAFVDTIAKGVTFIDESHAPELDQSRRMVERT